MVDVVDTSSTGRQVGQLLGTSLVQTPDGVELAYRVLEHIAALQRVERAWLVLRPSVLGPQVFVRGRQPASPAVLADLLSRPPGLYTDPDGADLDVRQALAGTCNLVLSAQAAAAVAAVDVDSGLAARSVTEAAVTRVAAQAARHGWPTTVVLLEVAADDDERWPAFCTALGSALRTGDEAGVAGPGQALAVLGNAETDVARPFLARLRSTLEAAGIGDVDFSSAVAHTPEETVDPRELWRLLRERLGTPEVSVAEVIPGGVLPGPLELELRSLPGVVSVGITAGSTPATGGGTQLTVAAVDPADTLRLEVTRVLGDQLAEATVNLVPVTVPGGIPAPAAPATSPAPPPADDASQSTPSEHVDTPVTAGQAASPPEGAPMTSGAVAQDAPDFRPENPSAGPRNGNGRHGPHPSPLSRVTLLTVRFDPDTGTSQVDLAYGTARATGRATAGPLAGGAQATLAALEALGLDVPYYLVSAEQATRIVGEPVIVVLAPRVTAGERPAGLGQRRLTRIGVAEGAEPVEAASRATLGALNRFLTREKKVPAT